MELKSPLSEIDLLAAVKSGDNLAEYLDKDDLEHIGLEIVQNYEDDLVSRREWEKVNEEALKLALQVMEEKTFPWRGASNVKFPLLTVASLQFASRAYPALIKPPEIVRCKARGPDPDGTKRKAAECISAHMSYQVLDEDLGWEEEHDKLTTCLSIVGTCFKKTFFDPVAGHNRAQLVLPQDLVINYWTTSMTDADRMTHRFRIWDREVTSRMRKQYYLEQDLGEAERPEALDSDERTKLEPPVGEGPRLILEQHCFLDLDDDDYPEPYIVTVDKSSGKVLRIAARWERIERDSAGRFAEIVPTQHFVKYGFVPSPDGGFYDLGWGALLGPINESVNTLINQLIDSGTLQNGNSGFIGRGARMQGGTMRFQPFEWKRVNVAGGTLKESIVPLPVNSPSPVLFQLLGLLVTYGERISSVTDIMTGDNPGQNTPAYNAQQMMEQGMKVFVGIFKRMYRSMGEEFRLLYRLNRKYMPESDVIRTGGEDLTVLRKYYQMIDDGSIRPAADPNSIMAETNIRKNMFVAERATMIPGYDPVQVELKLLEAMDITDVDKLFPLNPDGSLKYPPKPNPEIEVKIAEEQRRALDSRDRIANDRMNTQIKAHLAQGQLAEMEANTLYLLAKAKAEGGNMDIQRMELMLKAVSDKRQGMERVLEHMETMEDQSVKREQIEAQKEIAAKRGPSNGG